jgi:hypothetical protein
MVEEYEIDARIDAVNQQLDYAQARAGPRAQGERRTLDTSGAQAPATRSSHR